MRPAEIEAFILSNTEAMTAPLVPEIRLRLASEIVPLWQASWMPHSSFSSPAQRPDR